MQAECGLDLPRELQADFAEAIKARAGTAQGLVSAAQVQKIFWREYMIGLPTMSLLLQCPSRNASIWLARASFRLRRGDLIRRVSDHPAVVCAERLRSMGVDVHVLNVYSHYVGVSGRVVVYARCAAGFPVWGVGISRDAVTASLHAVLSAVGRGHRMAERITQADVAASGRAITADVNVAPARASAPPSARR